MTHTTSKEIQPAIFVIFGITGDLAQRKLLPALYHLLQDDLLHEHTTIVGVSRRELSNDELLQKVEEWVTKLDGSCDPAVLTKFRDCLQMVQLDSTVGSEYDRLKLHLDGIEEQHGLCMQRLFYLSLPPQVYQPVIAHLGEHGLNAGCHHEEAESRLLVEKPFGYDLTSAQELVANTAKHFAEEQIYRIDHYLAKETAQNVTVFRNHNPVFAASWNNQHVSAIDLAFVEKIGVEGRAEFYDNVGALRDVVQNHLMQLLALATMEPLNTLDANALHDAKRDLLAAVRTIDPHATPVTRAQYNGYQNEVGNLGSTTETYVKLTLAIDNERWRGVPITLTAGKALAAKDTSITITFVDGNKEQTMNRLTFHIQPNEGIDVALTVKQPGFDDITDIATMSFSYAHAFGDASHPDAYERVLLDSVRGDRSLFATSDEVLESWRVVQPVLDMWSKHTDDMLTYEPGSNGPSA